MLYSEKPAPTETRFGHMNGWPSPQKKQVLQGTEVSMATASPGLTWLTLSPTALTTPATSCPSTRGGGYSPMLPSSRCRSVAHTPQLTTSTSTSRGPSGGKGRSSSRRSPVPYHTAESELFGKADTTIRPNLPPRCARRSQPQRILSP